MRRTSRLGLCLLAFLAAASTLQAQDVPTRKNSEEAFLSFNFGRANGVVSSLFWKGQFLIPVGELLRAASIDATFEPAARRISGYYVHPDRRYTIDVAQKTARVGERTTAIAPEEVFADTADLFVAPAVLERSFGWKISVSMSDLKMQIVSTDTLPLDIEALRATHRAVTLPYLAPDAPLQYPRVASLFEPGLARYGVQVSSVAGMQNVDLDIAAAGQLAAGDAQIAFTTAAEQPGKFGSFTGRWRYAPLNSHIPVSSIAAGNLFTNGLSSAPFKGVQISNAPLTPRLQLGDYVVEGKSGPNWDVELYYEEQLLGRTTADAQGRYRFVIPMTYGSAIVAIRQYAPGGAMRVEERRLQVPHALLPAGITEYTADLGEQDRTNNLFWTTRVAHGLTNGLTTFVGYERRNDILAGRTDAAYGGMTLRLPSTYTATIEAAPNVFNRFTIDGLYASGLSLSLSGTDHAGISAYNPLRLDKSVHGSFFAPVGGRSAPFTLRVGGEWLRYLNGNQSASADIGITSPLPGGQIRVGTRRGVLQQSGTRYVLRDEWTATYTASLYGAYSGLLEKFRGSLVDVTADYDRVTHQMSNVQADLSRPVTISSRIGASFRYDPRLGNSSFALQYSYTGSLLNGSISASRGNGVSEFTTSARGSVGYDRHRGAAELSAQDWTGKAAATFIVFVDRNGNGVPDKDEPRVNGDAVEFRESVIGKLTSDSAFVSVDLLPYHRYSVTVHPERVANPLLVAVNPSFSFMTDPDMFKLIYVPIVAGGIVEGVVQYAAGAPVGGLTVRVADEHDNVVATDRSFSDGAFYITGLRPGKYHIVIDAEHLRALNATADTPSFAIQVTPDGDIVSGVTVTVHKNADKPAQ